MKRRHSHIQNRESGNVLFYILIAVALIAALSFAVTRSGDSGISGLSKEQRRLYAAELIEYSNSIANAVAKLRLSGVTETDLCFDDPGWPDSVDYDHTGCASDSNKIFHSSGGKILWQKIPAEGLSAAAAPDYLWHITGANHITNIGSDCNTANCAELLLTADKLAKDICIKINESLSVPNPSGDPPVEDSFTEETFQGEYGNESTIGADNDSPLAGKKAGCFLVTGKGYRFYRVLRAR